MQDLSKKNGLTLQYDAIVLGTRPGWLTQDGQLGDRHTYPGWHARPGS